MRLWLNDNGWFDFSTSRTPQWFTVVRSPIFIDFLPGAGVWAWGKPVFTTESEGGVLWYSSSRGTGWLDTKDGTWCLFTSYPSNVIKDSESNLWVFVDGKLYTFDMEKQ